MIVNTTFDIPTQIAKGLADGSLERIGGVVRNANTKQVVTWLREVPGNSAQIVPGLSQLTAVASILNLGVSVAGFALILQKLNQLEESLKDTQAVLEKIDRKIELGFYAKFRAAVDLANNAMLLPAPEDRKASLHAALERFIESQYIYTGLVDDELKHQSPAVDEYWQTLAIAYLSEARCYLELEAPELSLNRLQKGASELQPRLKQYVEILLTSNPAAYLHPSLKEEIDLSRLTQIYQWMDPTLSENAVFDRLRDDFYGLQRYRRVDSGHKWLKSLPPAVIHRKELSGGGNQKKVQATERLPQLMDLMESLIETHRRFAAYQMELKAIAQLGLSFQEWQAIAPTEPQPQEATVMYLIPAEPIAI
ncbi:hypothetical protein [Sphaerothrix gracilis]|uniref:hypothetical protein n=1 Tax=Sphaerothrix gracilis TaxID=3151835 RepID=UPI0031FDC653